MKNFRFVPLILSIIAVLSLIPCPALALDEPVTTANAVMLVETTTGLELYSKNADSTVYPASTTKIMTVLLACEAINAGTVSAGDAVTASANMSYDLIDDGSSANIQVGETMTLENLLYCAMLVSGNDACNVIAEYIGGSISQFIDLMNARAAELGCTGTHFANTHGIPNENHYTTARDLSIIARAASENSLFMEICGTATHTVPATNLSDARELSNTNALINSDSGYGDGYFYDYATGMKTGSTSDAGYCLVSTATDGTLNLLCVVMGDTSTDLGGGETRINSFTDSVTLLDWAFDGYAYRDVLRETEFVAEAPVSMASGTDTVSLRPQDSIQLLLPTDEDLGSYEREIVIYSERDGEELTAPISAGTVLGEITVTKDGETVGTSPLVSSTSIELSKVEYMKQQISEFLHNGKVRAVFILCVILLALYLVWVIAYRVRRLAHVNSVRRARAARESASAAHAASHKTSRTSSGTSGAARRASGSAPHEPDIGFISPADYEASGTESAPPESADSGGEHEADYYDRFFR